MVNRHRARTGIFEIAPRANTLPDDGRGGVDEHVHLVARRDALDTGPDELRSVLSRKLARDGVSPCDPWFRQSVKAKGSPIEPGQVPCDEIPAPSQEDEPVRVHRPGARYTAAIGVVELQALAVPAGLGHRDQNTRIDTGGGLLPWKRNGHRCKCVDSAPERSGHDLDHLAQRPQRGLLDAHNRARLDRRVQPYADGDGFVVVEQERRKHGARRELVATIYAPSRLDGVAQVSEAVDVTTERPRRDLEASSQVGPRPVAPGLEQGQQAERARAGRGHLASIAVFRPRTGR